MPAERVKIVVDSTADIPPEWIGTLDIGVIPAFVNFGTQSYADDGLAITRTQFYERLKTAAELPRTAAPPIALAAQVIADQLAKADHVLVFTMSQVFSSIHNAFRVAGEQVDPARVTVIDSGTISMAEGWQAVIAAQAAAAGQSSAEIVALAKGVISHTRLIAVLDTLDFLRRSGRVSWFTSNLSSLLQIKPLLEVKPGGSVVSIGRVRTMSKAFAELLTISRQDTPFARLAIAHSNNRAAAEQIQQALVDVLPSAPYSVAIVDVNTALGTHIGPGCVGLMYVRA